MEDQNDNFILIPAKSGGGALVRHSQVAGGRANGADGAILYLASGPSVYTTATIASLAKRLRDYDAPLVVAFMEGNRGTSQSCDCSVGNTVSV